MSLCLIRVEEKPVLDLCRVDDSPPTPSLPPSLPSSQTESSVSPAKMEELNLFRGDTGEGEEG